MKKLVMTAIILASLAIAGEAFIFATQKENVEDTHKKAVRADYRIYAPTLPDTLYFAGERVPMDIFYVREALDRELMSNMYFQSNTLGCVKRAGRYFPIIEPILKKNGIPDDFKYLCVIESGLKNVTSPAQAQGFWQFIKSTGANYGLEINDEIDMRNDVVASTEAACKYLKSLKNQFGNWTSAAAAYNCGENGLNRRLNREGVKSYYDVRLNAETSRYVFRILALKLIMQNLQDYGYYVRKCDLYPPLTYTTKTLSGKDVDLYDFAKQCGCTYKALRMYNPWITTDKLKNKSGKTYTVKIPKTIKQKDLQGNKNAELIKGI